MGKSKKPNPRRIPASVADVEKAREEGRSEGYTQLLTLFLWVWCSDFGASDQDVERMGQRIEYYCKEIAAGRLKMKDIAEAMKDEHDWEVEINDI